MNVKTLLKICKATGRTIPCDMHDQINQTYYSESKAEHIPIAEMDIVHLIRAFNKMKTDKDIIKEFEQIVKKRMEN
jgi:hypothetical protein